MKKLDLIENILFCFLIIMSISVLFLKMPFIAKVAYYTGVYIGIVVSPKKNS